MRRWLCAWLVALSGCHAFYMDVDGRIAQRAAEPIDIPARGPSQLPDVSQENPAAGLVGLGLPVEPSAQKDEKQPDKGPKNAMMQRLMPSEKLVGRSVPDIVFPPAKATPQERDAFFKKQFAPLPALPNLPLAKPGPDGKPFTLTSLQQVALRTSPLIRQARFDVEAARGSALQAGLYPNPMIGYEASTAGQGDSEGNRSPGQQGGYVQQTIITAGKLKLAQLAAMREMQIAEQRRVQAEADLQAQVRAGYFAVLAAQKNFETAQALAELLDELYNVLYLQMTAGEVAAYEPMQIRVLAMQSRGVVIQAHNRYVSAWKQLAAHMGAPGLPLSAVEGRIDMPAPHFEHDPVLAYVTTNHSEVIAAQVGVEKARFQLRLAEVQPYPDVTVQLGFQKDYTAPPFGSVANINVGIPVPFWNRNQGNIQAARAQLQRALEDNNRVRNELTIKVAEAFERYGNNRSLLKMYQDTILPNQVQAFRAAVARHAAVGAKDVSYNDLVTSQQNLAGVVNAYLASLSDQWTAVVDIGHLLQTRDLFQIQPLDEVTPVPDVYEIIRDRPWRRR
jgi:cobalt-zinc-cadmium efflux system outer membrane protein